MLTLALLLQVAQPQPVNGQWAFVPTPAATYDVERKGDLTDASGATATLRSTSPQASRAVLMRAFDAGTLRMKRVRVRGEIKTTEIGSANVSLEVDADGGRRIAFVGGSETGFRGTTDWTPFDIEMPIASQAHQVTVRVSASGQGTVSVRNYRLAVTPLPPASTPLGPDAQADWDSAFSLVRKYSVWRDTLTWSAIDAELRPLAAGVQTAPDLYPVLRMLLTRLGDHHSTFMPPSEARSFNSTGSQNPLPEVKPLTGDVGYVRVPGFRGGDPVAIRAYTDTVHMRLAAAAANARCGWVVDLRTNTGGNMYPMIYGLRPLLGDQALGFFVSGGTRNAWASRSVLPSNLAGVLAPMESTSVAVLYGPRTASSGEIVAISFRGRPRTRSFGQPTGGFSTANAMFALPSRANLNLTTAIDADRNGFLYGGPIPPDEIIPATTPDDSTTLTRATDWLRSTCRK